MNWSSLRESDSGCGSQKRGERRETRDERSRAFLFQISRPVECKAYSTGVSASRFQLFFGDWIVDMVARRGSNVERRGASSRGLWVSAFQCFRISAFLRGLDRGYGGHRGVEQSRDQSRGFALWALWRCERISLLVTSHSLPATSHGGCAAYFSPCTCAQMVSIRYPNKNGYSVISVISQPRLKVSTRP